MATYSTGMTVVWGVHTFAEITSIDIDRYGDLSRGRSVDWNDSAGTVKITTLSSTGVGSANWNQKGLLTITGGSMGLTVNALYMGFSATAEVNGVTKFTVNFKILE